MRRQHPSDFPSASKVKHVRVSPSFRANPYPPPSVPPTQALQPWRYPGQQPKEKRAPKAKDSSSDSQPSHPRLSSSSRSLSRLVDGGRKQKALWFRRGSMTSPQTLVIPPFKVANLNGADVPSDPTSSSTALAELDPFTRMLWECHQHAVRSERKKVVFSMNSLMPDSYYMHIVKELHQSGHLERSALPLEDPMMYLSIKNKLNRNVRFILFDVDPATVPLIGMGAMSMPALYVVKRQAVALSLPDASQCKRVIPIGQVRELLERLHETENCRVVGIEVKVAQEYVGVPRSTQRFFQNHCLTCKEHQPLKHVQQLVHPILSQYSRHRYVIDLIQMAPCYVKHEGTYEYILTVTPRPIGRDENILRRVRVGIEPRPLSRQTNDQTICTQNTEIPGPRGLVIAIRVTPISGALHSPWSTTSLVTVGRHRCNTSSRRWWCGRFVSGGSRSASPTSSSLTTGRSSWHGR